MTLRRLALRDWEAEAWHAGRLSAVVRVFKSRHDWYENDGQPFYRDYVFAEPDPVPVPCPLGAPGQPLWIAESWFHDPADYCWEASVSIPSKPAETFYKADCQDPRGLEWRSPMTMPQWASRDDAVHLDSRIVRVQELTEEDANDCGMCLRFIGDREVFGHPFHPNPTAESPLDAFNEQFIRDHGQAAWDRNDWVWIHRIGRES